MKSKAWTDEQAERRLKGLPSEQEQDRAEGFLFGLEGKSPISDDEALAILQGRQPKNAVRESTSRGRSEEPAHGPLARKIQAVVAQISDVLEASRRREQVLEVIRGHPAP